ncbi:MAG TPA: hypothetical protein VM537_07665 [Anaerolineae bacterium]|nr:hypothetical protein [Anaerolineae bacterium]
MNVLGFLRDASYEKLGPVEFYRTLLPLRELNKQAEGIQTMCIDKATIKGMTDAELGGRDIYTMARMFTTEGHQAFVDEIHRTGGVLVLDCDDDLTEAYRMVSGRGSEFCEVLGMVDFVTVSTQPLADLFASHTQRAPVVLRNHVDSAWMKGIAARSRRLIDGLTIGFSGSPTHQGDWYLPHVPFFRIGKDFPEVALALHGDNLPRYLEHIPEGVRLLHMEAVPFSEYPSRLAQFDIVLCAVDSGDGFNDGKSDLKALECMALGIVPVCSQFGPYVDLAAAGAPVVIIAEESRDGWYEAMRDVIQLADWRRWLSGRGPEWVRENRDMVVSGWKQWATFCGRIV